MGAAAGLAVGAVLGAVGITVIRMVDDPASVGLTSSRIDQARAVSSTLGYLSKGDIQTLAAVMPTEADIAGVVAVNSVTGESFIAWALDGGKAIALGPVLSGEGENLTLSYEKASLGDALSQGGRRGSAALLESHPLVSKKDWADLAATQQIQVGSGDARFVVFWDPNCDYCRKMKADVEGELEGQVTLHLVPVSLSAPADEVGRQIWPESEFDPAAAITAHNDLLVRLAGRPVTPLMIYQDASGRLRHRVGAPSTPEAWADLIALARS